jgi:hypothetical protein
VARCDLLEKTKLRFDREGIRFGFPQLDLHLDSGGSMEGGDRCIAPVSVKRAGDQADGD